MRLLGQEADQDLKCLCNHLFIQPFIYITIGIRTVFSGCLRCRSNISDVSKKGGSALCAQEQRGSERTEGPKGSHVNGCGCGCYKQSRAGAAQDLWHKIYPLSLLTLLPTTLLQLGQKLSKNTAISLTLLKTGGKAYSCFSPQTIPSVRGKPTNPSAVSLWSFHITLY